MSTPRAVVLATRSGGKLRELRALFAARGIEVRSLDEAGIPESPLEDSLEVHETFEENARAKARHFAGLLPGQAVLADDSGLEVDALGGAPGVRSKRWAGATGEGGVVDAANNAHLLRALEGHADRRARYVAVVVVVQGGREWLARGECGGRILEEARGTGGFGYDPFFLSDELARTFGEAGAEEKARVSHRARAVRAVLAEWDR